MIVSNKNLLFQGSIFRVELLVCREGIQVLSCYMNFLGYLGSTLFSMVSRWYFGISLSSSDQKTNLLHQYRPSIYIDSHPHINILVCLENKATKKYRKLEDLGRSIYSMIQIQSFQLFYFSSSAVSKQSPHEYTWPGIQVHCKQLV